MTALQQAAATYVRPNGPRDAWPIFPLVEGLKNPFKDSNGFKDATTDHEKVNRWWTTRPNANIGLATGEPSGILVLDIDNKDGHDGSSSLAELERDLGPLPETVEALTPTGGRHLYFKNPGILPVKSVAGIKDGLDIRCNGGFVVLPPSKRLDCGGKEYEWEIEHYPNSTPLAELPHTWLDWLALQKGKTGGHVVALDKGERNDALFRYGCSLWARSWPEDKLTKQMETINANASPPLPERELQRVIKSITKYPPGTPMTEYKQLPTQTSERRARLTIEALEGELQARGIELKHNDITGELDTNARTASGRLMQMEALKTALHSELSATYSGVTIDTLERYLSYLAQEHAYNPVLDLLAATKWDGRDRLPDVYALLGLPTDPGAEDVETEGGLSRILVRKWLLQTVALLFNSLDPAIGEPFGADGCLVLNGEPLGADNQGAGKTSFFARLGMRADWVHVGGIVDDRDKDTKRRVVTAWITELGEVESTLKSDIERLKSFIVDPVDRYRLPYARIDVVAPRHTSLCATCNSGRYLIDQTGERRWWTIPLTRKMPWDEIQQLDALQLWAQIYATVAPMTQAERAACYRLTDDERRALAERNGEHEKLLKGQQEVMDILQEGGGSNDLRDWDYMTVTQFKMAYEDTLHGYSAQQIGAALRACGVEIIHGKKGSHACLPKPQFSSYH